MTQTALAKDSKGHARPGGGSGGTSGEPAHPLEGLLDAVGNRGMQAIAATAGVPSPPAISRSVSSGTLQRVCAGGSDESTECGQQTHSLPWVQRKASDGAGTPSMSRSLAASALHGQGTGRPLDTPTKRFMEPRLGRDLDGVRVHTDAAAAQSARMLSAQAFTVGGDIHFAAGQYRPDTVPGRRLLAHELTHTIQQVGSPGGNGVQHSVGISHPNDPSEREAESIANHIVGSAARPRAQDSGYPDQPVNTVVRVQSALQIQRQPAGPPTDPGPGSTPTPAPAGAPKEPNASMPEPNASVPPATQAPAAPTSPIVIFEGVPLAADAKFLRYQLEQMAPAKGMDAVDSFAYRFINMPAEESLKYTLQGATADQIADIKIYLKEEILHLEYDIKEFLKQFEDQATTVTTTLLDNSKKEIEQELRHYGISETDVPTGEGSVTVYSMGDTGAGAALKLCAAALAKKRREVNRAANASAAAQNELNRAGVNNPFHIGLAGLEHSADSLRTDWLRKEDEYRDLANAKQKDYPILAAYTTGPDAVAHLEAIAAMSPAALAQEIGGLAEQRLANVQTVQKELGKRFSIWKAPNIISITKKQMNATPVQSRAVQDKTAQVQADEADSKKLLAAVALGLGLLAAIPTGGASLVLAGIATTAAVVGAGLAIYTGYEHLQEYELQSAAAGSAFDKANAIAKDDPSLLWLALDIVGAVADVFAAAAAFKSLRAALELVKARGLTELPGVALAARRAGLGAEASGRLMAAAARGSGAAGGVEATLEAIRNVYRRLDPAGLDRDLADSFKLAADRLMEAGNVHILPRGNPNARWRAITDALGDTDVAKALNKEFAQGKTLGYYVNLNGTDTVLLLDGESAPTLSGVLAHEIAHQMQTIRLDLSTMETFESEFQALAAEREYLRLLAPEDAAMLSPDLREVRDAKDVLELERITRAKNKGVGVAWLTPDIVAAGPAGVLQAMSARILDALRALPKP